MNPQCRFDEFKRAARSATLRAFPSAVLPEPSEAKPRVSLNAPTIGTFAGSGIYLQSKKRGFKFPIQPRTALDRPSQVEKSPFQRRTTSHPERGTTIVAQRMVASWRGYGACLSDSEERAS